MALTRDHQSYQSLKYEKISSKISGSKPVMLREKFLIMAQNNNAMPYKITLADTKCKIQKKTTRPQL